MLKIDLISFFFFAAINRFCLACIAERDYRRRFSDGGGDGGGGGGVVNIEILTKVKVLKCHHNLESIWT